MPAWATGVEHQFGIVGRESLQAHAEAEIDRAVIAGGRMALAFPFWGLV